MTMQPPPNTRLRPLSREEVRGLDVRAAEDLALPTLVLMENAGRGAAEVLRRWAGPSARIVIVCGPGNNGGDGGVVARHLDAWGHPVRAVWLAERAKLRGDAAAQWSILDRSGVDQASLADAERFAELIKDADWLVDGLFGTGLSRPVEGPMRAAIESMNRSGKPILALDLPSGLDCDTGQPLGAAVRARVTASFVAPKLGFSQPGAAEYTGEVEVVEIGLPRCLIAPFLNDSPKNPIGEPGS
jgi:NAD(P)H-hydrate epimerase